MTLQDHVHQLTRPHLTRRPDGKYVEQAALLDQLAEAVKPSRSGRGGSSSERPLEVSTEAIELWKTLDNQARQEEMERRGTTRGTLGGILAGWTGEKRDDWVGHLEHVTLDIIDQIHAFLDPPPKRRPLGAPCYACGELWASGVDGDRAHAVTLGTHDAETGGLRNAADMDMACAACGAQWVGREMSWPLSVIRDPGPTNADHPGRTMVRS